jgi:hypothetical protein
MESEAQKKKPYSAPVLTKLTLEQAKKHVAARKNCSAEEAAQLLQSLRQTPTTDCIDQNWKRSA